MTKSKSSKFHFGTLIIVLILVGCEKNAEIENTTICDIHSPSMNINNDYVINQAKIFLHLLYGREAYVYYNRPIAPPKASWSKESNRWVVFFNHPLAGFTIELNDDASKANYLFMDGSVFLKSGDAHKADQIIPLYSIEEMVDLFGDHGKKAYLQEKVKVNN